MGRFDRELRLAWLIPPIRSTLRGTLRGQRSVQKGIEAPADVTIEERSIPGPDGAPPLRLKVFTPKGVRPSSPALFWLHGGGYIGGTPEQNDAKNVLWARDLGIVVLAPSYRLAPNDPHPAAVEDAYAALTWVARNSALLGIDPDRIAIGGASAGGGLAAALALVAHDRGEVTPVFQLLVYPMLDDRTALRTDLDLSGVRVWRPQNNHFGWSQYLGTEPGGSDVPEYAAPSRRRDLSGLPPAWIGVGGNDLFHDEDVEYARRLDAAGVPTELVVEPGAFHGWNYLFTKAEITRRFEASQHRALRVGLGLEPA